jgi:RNA polymerase-binding transcription factor DksA
MQLPGEDDLRAERAEVVARITAMQADFAAVVAASESSNADDEHDPEGATIAFERQQLAALLSQAQRRVEDLDRALQQLAAGSFGACERCGQPIGAERLAARPSARTCITCARRG